MDVSNYLFSPTSKNPNRFIVLPVLTKLSAKLRH
ncbi:hypothetical protein AX016_3173 [Cellulophaga sp. RHA19]|nr:hypothetical protein AX016_3173 [Cellulophaga sp. RHA19]